MDDRAVAAIQARMSERIKRQYQHINRPIDNPPKVRRLGRTAFRRKASEGTLASVADATQQRVSSTQFKEKLSKLEPWRLEPESVKKGKNLHLNILKAHADKRFNDWATERAITLGIPEDDFLVGIIESVRRIEWETVKLLCSNGLTRNRALPLTVFHHDPHNSVGVVSDAKAKASWDKHEPSIVRSAALFDKELALEQTRTGARFSSTDEYDNSYSGAFGAGNWQVVGLNSTAVMDSVDRLLGSRREDPYRTIYYAPWDLAALTVEETLHYMGYQDQELDLQMAEKRKEPGFIEVSKHYGQGYEQDVPAHRELNFLARDFASKLLAERGDELFEPLREKIGGTLVKVNEAKAPPRGII